MSTHRGPARGPRSACAPARARLVRALWTPLCARWTNAVFGGPRETHATRGVTRATRPARNRACCEAWRPTRPQQRDCVGRPARRAGRHPRGRVGGTAVRHVDGGGRARGPHPVRRGGCGACGGRALGGACQGSRAHARTHASAHARRSSCAHERTVETRAHPCRTQKGGGLCVGIHHASFPRFFSGRSACLCVCLFVGLALPWGSCRPAPRARACERSRPSGARRRWPSRRAGQVSLHCATERVPADRSDEVRGCAELEAAGSSSCQ